MFITLFRFVTVLCGTDNIPRKQIQGAQWNVHNIVMWDCQYSM
jgi:hypothetical protein